MRECGRSRGWVSRWGRSDERDGRLVNQQRTLTARDAACGHTRSWGSGRRVPDSMQKLARKRRDTADTEMLKKCLLLLLRQ